MSKRLLGIVLTLLFLLPFSQAARAEEPKEVARNIRVLLEKSYEGIKSGDRDKAKALATEAYFFEFEGKGLETALGARSAERMAEIEEHFVRLIDEIDSGKDKEEIRKSIDELSEKIRLSVDYLEKGREGGNLSLLVNSLIIILREGFEAILILSALAAYLVKTGNGEKVRVIYAGAGAALFASLVAAVVFQLFFHSFTGSKAAMEGVTLLLATAVLFYVSYWLVSNVRVVRWQRFIKSKVEGAAGQGSVYTLGFAAFLAVFREGAETVLFYQALYSGADGGGAYILGGFAIGAVALVGVFMALKYGSLKVPIGPFFAVTSTLLYYLAFTFAGKGILELQEAGWLSNTPVRVIPSVSFLGIYPSWEGVSIQSLMLLAMAVAVVYSFLVKPRREREKRLKEIFHIAGDISGLHDTLEHIKAHTLLCQKLSNEREGEEIEEIKGHLKEIDSKTHEVLEHLKKFEDALKDAFEDMEETIRRENRPIERLPRKT